MNKTQFAGLVAILLSILHGALAFTATLDKSPTYDEPTHLAAGYSYWLRNDFRLDAENGNLPARWAALPLLLNPPNFIAPNDPAWSQVSAGRTGNRFFYHSGNNPERMLMQGRAMMSILSAALCLLIFFCSQKLFGPIGGLISATLAVCDPNLLAHGALVTSDVAAALFFLAASWTTWRLFQCLSFRTVLLAALSISGLVLSKMSAPVFAIVAALLAGIAIFSGEAIDIQFANFRRSVTSRKEKLLVIATTATVIAAVSILAIWAAFGFRFASFTEPGQPREVLNWRWDYFLKQPGLASSVIGFARNHHLLPEAYLYGLLFTAQTSTARPAFLNNQWSDVGFRSFFSRAVLYKTPLPVLGLLTVGLIAAFVRWKRRGFARICARDLVVLAPIWTLLIVYVAVAWQSKLNIGFRHLLPIYPAIFIACGAAACLLNHTRTQLAGLVIATMLSWHVAESFFVRPNYLAYFNQIPGGPANGYKHLVDSSLDWGQDLPALKAWIDEHSSDQRAYLAYFGSADPSWYQIRATDLPEKSANVLPLDPGLYCISATILQHVYETEQGKWAAPYEMAYQNGVRWLQAQGTIANTIPDEAQTIRAKRFQRLRFARLCAFLRHRRPTANIGYSILVFQLNGNDLREALEGPPAELEPSVEVASD